MSSPKRNPTQQAKSRRKQPPRSRGNEQSSFSKRLQIHRKTAKNSLKRMAESPASSAMTTFVIAVALLLPALLFALNGNITAALNNFESQAQITAYLEDDVPNDRGREVSDGLLTLESTTTVEFITSGQALEEFSSASGFDQLLGDLASNPLPASNVISPSDISPGALDSLVSELEAIEEVSFVQLDNRWLQRLAAISDFIVIVAQLLMVIVVLGLFFIVGNTIKLAIENRRNEIRVIKLVGGTDMFIARPFLYSGLFFGLAGGVLACILQLIVLIIFNSSLQNLLSLYEGSFQLQGFGVLPAIALVLCGGISAWISALMVSLANIRAIDP